MSRRRSAKLMLLPVVSAGLVLSGCGQPSRMPLARSVLSGPARLVWWYVDFENDVRPPVVGVEIALEGSRTEQWILARNGIRRYRFDGGNQVYAGLPMPAWSTCNDFEFVRNWLTYYLPHRVRSPLPLEAVAGLSTMADVVRLMQVHWPEQMVSPPRGMTSHAVAEQTDQFRHGLSELLKAL